MAAETALAPAPSSLPEPVQRRGISEAQWRTLFNLFPGAKPDSVLLVWDYCKSRQLDPMKKPCHIVEMDLKVNGQWTKRDVVMPGIYEYRITAQRTGLYLGHTEPEYGEVLEFAGVKAPAWCAMTFYRWNDKAREKVPFPVKVWFSEVVATNREGKANARWTKAPIQMLTKCTEAAGLREAFPEEFGGEPTAEEMDGRSIGCDEEPKKERIQPAQRKSAASEPVTTTVVDAEPVADAEPAQKAADLDHAEAPEAPKDAPANVGTITDIKPVGNGAIVTLNTGFMCGTTKADFLSALSSLAEAGTVVELVTKAPKSDKHAPSIQEIIPIRDGEAAS